MLRWPIATWLVWQTHIGRYVPNIGGSQLADRLVFAFVAGLLTTAAAAISWHLYERQFPRLKSGFPYGPAHPRPAPDEVAHNDARQHPPSDL